MGENCLRPRMRVVNWNDWAWLPARKMFKPSAPEVCGLENVISITSVVVLLSASEIFCIRDPQQRGNRDFGHVCMLPNTWVKLKPLGRGLDDFQSLFWYLSLCSCNQWLDKCMYFLPKKKCLKVTFIGNPSKVNYREDTQNKQLNHGATITYVSLLHTNT